MRTRKVSRYWCDFCDKGGLQKHAMAVHEKHCTLNPGRECRVCQIVDPERDSSFVKKTLPELIALLPQISDYTPDGAEWYSDCTPEGAEWYRAIDAAVPILRAATGDCPACMMAALRQAKIPLLCATGFDFSAEMKSLFDDINAAENQALY